MPITSRIDDLRSFNVIKTTSPFTDPPTQEKLKNISIIFCDCGNLGFIPRLNLKPIQEEMELFGVKVQSFPLLHGNSTTYGYRFGNTAYLTDVKTIPKDSYKKLKHLDLLILDALRYKPHPTHLSLPEALAEIEKIRPRRTVFTHITHDVDYGTANRELPENVELAYDGMVIDLNENCPPP
jgi:phosphoribosyl 1,2-cyclic phosphate phosphodiesterase